MKEDLWQKTDPKMRTVENRLTHWWALESSTGKGY